MRILQIAHHACARVQKQADALKIKGHEVSLISNRTPRNWFKYKHYLKFYSAEQLRNAVKLFDNYDIIHVHNEPNWLLIVAREALPAKKMIMDVHDSMAYRTEEVDLQSNEERAAFYMADGFVYPSEDCMEISKPDKPSIVLYPYVNRADYQLAPWRYRGGIVYEGRIDHPDDTDGILDYADYTDLCEEMRRAGIPFNIYSPKIKEKRLMDHYNKHGAILQKPLEISGMIKSLGLYDWGLCGNLKVWKDWQVAMPNKLFEYMAGGIPIIALNAKSVGQFVEKHGVGIAVESIAEIKARWDERAECQRQVFLKRHQFTMESHIHKLEELYREVLK